MFVLSGRSVNKDDKWYSIVWYKALCAFSGTVSSPPIRQSDLTIHDPDTEFYLLPYTRSFHGAFAKDVTCQQGTLTPPDTWLRPLLDLHML